jgi:hypothetical protein
MTAVLSVYSFARRVFCRSQSATRLQCTRHVLQARGRCAASRARALREWLVALVSLMATGGACAQTQQFYFNTPAGNVNFYAADPVTSCTNAANYWYGYDFGGHAINVRQPPPPYQVGYRSDANLTT